MACKTFFSVIKYLDLYANDDSMQEEQIRIMIFLTILFFNVMIYFLKAFIGNFIYTDKTLVNSNYLSNFLHMLQAISSIK